MDMFILMINEVKIQSDVFILELGVVRESLGEQATLS